MRAGRRRGSGSPDPPLTKAVVVARGPAEASISDPVNWQPRKWIGWLGAGAVWLAAAQAPAAPREDAASQFRWLSVEPPKAALGLEVEGEWERGNLRGAGSIFQRHYYYAAPTLSLQFRGSVYHPNLLEFDLRVEDGLSWQEQYVNQSVGASGAGTETKTQFLQRYHGHLDLLREKPYAMTLYADKDHNFRKYDFYSRAVVDTQRLGGRWGYATGPLPFGITFNHLEEDTTGLSRPSEMKEDTFTFDLRPTRHRNAATSFSYTFDKYSRQESGFPIQQGTYHTANLSDSETWGSDDRYRLHSGWFYSRLTDAPVPNRSLRIHENLAVKHSKRLSSFYNLAYDSRSSGPSDHHGYSGQAALRYQPWECLSSAVDLHGLGQDSTSPGSSSASRRYGLGLNEILTKPLGNKVTLSAGYNGTYDWQRQDNAGQILAIVGEAHVLTDGAVTYLKQAGVILATIRVTDPLGKVYPPHVYQVIPHGNLVEIKRLNLIGDPNVIPDGGTVLVDYQIQAQPTAKYAILSHQFQLRLDFFRRLLGSYGRANLVDHFGAAGIVVQNVRSLTGGVDLNWRWLRAGAEYEDYDSNLAPFTDKRLFQSLFFELHDTASLNFDFNQGWTWFRDTDRHRTSYDFRSRYRMRLSRYWAWNTEGGMRFERGPGFDQNLGIFNTGMEYARGQLTVKINYDLQSQDYLGDERRRNFFSLRLMRAF